LVLKCLPSSPWLLNECHILPPLKTTHFNIILIFVKKEFQCNRLIFDCVSVSFWGLSVEELRNYFCTNPACESVELFNIILSFFLDLGIHRRIILIWFLR
jgi:hypothetical protein